MSANALIQQGETQNQLAQARAVGREVEDDEAVVRGGAVRGVGGGAVEEMQCLRGIELAGRVLCDVSCVT